MTRAIVRPALASVAAFAAALGASCGDPTQVPLDQVNFDRPVDIAFACYGNMRVTGTADTIETAQPTAFCEERTKRLIDDTLPDLPAGRADVTSPAWYAFVLQSAAGTVAVANWSTAQISESFLANAILVLDTDPLTPGKNAISIGEDPVAIATDKSGCYEVTANAGSCDLSVLDINSALDGNVETPVRVDRLRVMNGAKELRSKPVAMIAGPGDSATGKTCSVSAANELQPSGVVYIAYPSCHVVAAVDMSSGTEGRVIAAIQFDAAGVATSLTGAALDGLSCPDECAGAPPLPGTRPVALSLKVDAGAGAAPVPTTRLAIGAENSDLVTIVELDDSALPRATAPVSQIQLETTKVESKPNAKVGVMSLALSPVIGMGGAGGTNNDADPTAVLGQYVYAVATDNTVRVVDVLNVRSECDTQVDGRFVRAETDIAKLQCFRVDDPAKPPRRSGARGPGIQLTDATDAPIPTSVAIVKGRTDTPVLPGPTTLVGYFAIITASTGQAFVVNIDDDRSPDLFDPTKPQSTAPVLAMAHQLRDNFDKRDAEPSADRCTTADANTSVGGPRISATPARNLPSGTLAADNAAEMPGLLQFKCGATASNVSPISELQFGAPEGAASTVAGATIGVDGIDYNVRDRAYPDLRSVRTESWTITWEGQLTFDTDVTAIDGRLVRQGQMVVDQTGMRLLDESRPFCELGVEPFDIVQFRGCDPVNLDNDCPSGYTCYVHPDSKVSGIGSCMLATDAPRLSNACRDFLTTMRRYTVGRPESHSLTLLPRKHELYATPLNGCTDDLPDDQIVSSQCNVLADYVANNVAGKNAAADRYVRQLFVMDPDQSGKLIPDPNQKSFTRWECRTDEARAPISPTNKRCIQTCAFHLTGDAHKDEPGYDGLDRDADCASGTICQGATPATRGVCMEGVVPPPACVAGPQMFDVRASEAFTVIGTRSGYLHPIIEAKGMSAVGVPDGACIRDPAPNRLQIGRIPLKAPACNTAADPITGEILPRTDPPVFDANPCSLPVTQTAYEKEYKPEILPPPDGMAKCELTDPPRDANDAVLPRQPVTRPTTAIQFSNRAMTFHLVDPTYPGDLYCPGDRRGAFQDVAMVVPGVSPAALGYQIAFNQSSGYQPMTLPISPVYPVKVVRGPADSIWVLDDGDFLSNQIGLPSTRGQVFRIEAVAPGHVDQVR